MDNSGWQKTSLNAVNRYRNRGKYDFETIHSIVDKTPILHVSFNSAALDTGDESDAQPQYPVILPMMGFTGNFKEPHSSLSSPRSLYLHGYVASRLMRTAKTTETNRTGHINHDSGMPVCVAATLFDGVVLALTPNHHSCNYRSAVVFGRAHVVTDEAERLWAMEAITDNLVPGRWNATRYPNATELKSTGILRVDIESASAKIRTGSTGEARSDLNDEDMRRRVWAGVVPAHQVWGEPIEANTNKMVHVPEYITEWVAKETQEAKEYAYSAAK